ncbi:MAG: ATP-binding protein [Fimbriimonas sp.]
MLQRHLFRNVDDALTDTPVILIHGPRQAGKSTLAEQVAKDRFAGRRVTLDDPIAAELARTDPMAFLNAHPAPVMIDEVQRAPQLFLPIKLLVDRDRAPGKFLLTGSANVLNLPKMADSLAGRMEVIDLLPFSQGELNGGEDGLVDALFEEAFEPGHEPLSEEELVERVVRGGFPEAALRASAARRTPWYENYVRTLLERDVKDIADIEGLAQMPLLFSLLATRTGSVLNVSSLATEVGIPYTSLKRYLSLLQTIFLLRLVPAWSANKEKTFTKTPKAYLVDTGLLCHLANHDLRALKGDRLRFGPILENFVAMELAKQCSFGTVRPWLLHLRTVRHLEVDFVLEARGGGIVGVQVKNAPTLRFEDANGLRYLREVVGDRFRRGVVLYTGNEVVPLDKDIVGLPMSALWATKRPE